MTRVWAVLFLVGLPAAGAAAVVVLIAWTTPGRDARLRADAHRCAQRDLLEHLDRFLDDEPDASAERARDHLDEIYVRNLTKELLP